MMGCPFAKFAKFAVCKTIVFVCMTYYELSE